ncbi:NYN domain-containing protein [Eubacteriales bacterium OttesenSCG-928-A19]|nr:NYN domain-containing protein [Eubacteriales bacterium OttesenSCG-928-A19]
MDEFDRNTDSYYWHVPVAKRTYNIVSHVAYLIGVKRDFFERGKLCAGVYDQLETQKAAHVIRALCRLRNALMRNIQDVENAFRYHMKNLDSLPHLFDLEDIEYLQNNQVPLLKSNAKPMTYLSAINQHIANHIYACNELFPLWVEWPYIRELFLMPDAGKEASVRKTIAAYQFRSTWFPFQCYLNWTFAEDDGNILHYDAKFMTLLYSQHGTVFNDYHMVTDAGFDTQNNFHRFVSENEKVTFIVDCENSDPYRLCATFRNLATYVPDYASHIGKVFLYDDVHTAATWRIFDRYINGIPIERKVVRRIKDRKSQVDVSMTAGACEEFYANNTKAFVIVSSDSDFFALMQALPAAKFMVMLEHGKQSQQFLDALVNAGIFYCFIDSFSQGTINDIKTDVLRMQVGEYIDDSLNLNINTMMAAVCKKARIQISPSEEKKFIDKYITRIRLFIDPNGDISLTLPD